MFLTDVLPIDPDRVRRIREIKPVIVDTIDTVRDSINATEDTLVDSVAQSQVILENAGQSEASLLWPIAVVALALGACLYLAYLYRSRLAAK
ncbi:MAG: hypothetical protein J6W56_06430 [Prevotella sp.]|nr:hypothetical protein [Prevotella sp.]